METSRISHVGEPAGIIALSSRVTSPQAAHDQGSWIIHPPTVETRRCPRSGLRVRGRRRCRDALKAKASSRAMHGVPQTLNGPKITPSQGVQQRNDILPAVQQKPRDPFG